MIGSKVMHPLKSELHWPCGPVRALDMAEATATHPNHLIFESSNICNFENTFEHLGMLRGHLSRVWVAAALVCSPLCWQEMETECCLHKAMANHGMPGAKPRARCDNLHTQSQQRSPCSSDPSCRDLPRWMQSTRWVVASKQLSRCYPQCFQSLSPARSRLPLVL